MKAYIVVTTILNFIGVLIFGIAASAYAYGAPASVVINMLMCLVFGVWGVCAWVQANEQKHE